MVRDPSIVSPSLAGVFMGGVHNKHGTGSRCTLLGCPQDPKKEKLRLARNFPLSFARQMMTIDVGRPPPDEHTSEGGRDDRGVPYHAESTLSSAQVLKVDRGRCTRAAIRAGSQKRSCAVLTAPS